jgi:hypothetical protein
MLQVLLGVMQRLGLFFVLVGQASVEEFCMEVEHRSPRLSRLMTLPAYRRSTFMFRFNIVGAGSRLIVTLATVMLVSGSVQAAIDLETALRAHETTIGSLNSFEMRVEVHAPSPETMRVLVAIATGTAGQPVLWQRYRWLLDGSKERIQIEPFQQTRNGDGLVMNIDDIVRDGAVEKVLSNWDWKQPQKISPAKQGSVVAEVRPQTDSFRYRDPAQPALIYPRFELSEPRAPLRLFVKRFQEKSCIEDGSDVVIELRGDALGTYKDDERVKVVLSKPNAYLIRSFVHEKVRAVAAKDYGQGWSRFQFEVTRFQSIGPGIPFPESVRYSIVDAFKQAEVAYSINTFSCVSANKSIEPDLFKLDFPKDVLVTDAVEDPKIPKWYLIGENGTRIPIRSKSDLALYDKSARHASANSMWLIVNGVVFVVAIGLLARHLRRRRRR